MLQMWILRGSEGYAIQHLTVQYALIMAFFWSNYAVLSNYASVYLLGQGFHNTAIGLMIAIASLLSAITQPALGAYADQDRSPSVKIILIILIGLFLAAAVLIPVFAGSSSLLLIVAYAIALMLMQSMTPLTNALGTLSANAGNQVNFGIARGIGSLAYAVVSLLIGWLSQAYGISTIPVVTIALYVALGLCLFLFPFEKRPVPARSTADARFLKKYPGFVVVLIAASCLYSSHVLLGNFAFQIISAKGGNSESLGVAYAIAAVMELPMMFFFTRLLRRMSAGKWLVLSGFAFLAKCICTWIVGSVIGYYFVQTMQLLAYAVITVASVYYIDSIMEPQDAVKGQAFFTMTNMIGAVMASALGGWLLDVSGVSALLIAAIAFAGSGAILMGRGIIPEKETQH